MQTQFTAPTIVDLSNNKSIALSPVPLTADGNHYDEKWLQRVIYENPQLVPIDEVEPIFAGVVPVCMELPTSVGPLDLVFVNEQGLFTLVECKLWRNPEARRKVVGQILDYAQQISRWSYEDFDAAIRRSEKRSGDGLWDIASGAFGLPDERMFIDRVSRHLRQGEFLLLIVGDGIRENTESIAAFLQKYAGLSFAFGLVEERLFQLPETDRILVQPRILAKTVELGRLIVRAEPGLTVRYDSGPITSQTEPQTGRTLTEEMFVENAAGASGLADKLRLLFAQLKKNGFTIEATSRGKSLKVMPEAMKQNLLTMYPNGEIRNYGCGDTDIGRAYLERLARLLQDTTVKVGAEPWAATIVHKDGSAVRLEELVEISDQWLLLIQQVRDELSRAGA
jgi:hypothetical protein